MSSQRGSALCVAPLPHLSFSRRSSSQNTSSPSPSRSPSRSRSSARRRLTTNNLNHHVYSTNTTASNTAASSATTLVSSSPLPAQIPLPAHFSSRRKALNIAAHSAAKIPEWAAETRPPVRGRDKVTRNPVLARPYSDALPQSKSPSASLWPTENDDNEVDKSLAQSDVWRSLMSCPSPSTKKGKSKATGVVAPSSPAPTTAAVTAATAKPCSSPSSSAATPVIAILSATFQSQSPLDIDATTPPLPRTSSLSPLRSDSSYSSSSSSSSSPSSSRSLSPSSSTSTFITDPDNYSPPSLAPVPDECLSPKCAQRRLLEEDDHEEATPVSPRPLYVRVPYGRDPLTRLAVDCSTPVQGLRALKQEPHAASTQPTDSVRHGGNSTRRRFSFIYSALETLAGAGRIMVDSYAVHQPMEPTTYIARAAPVERDSLGLEKATLSPTDEDNCTPSPSTSPVARGRPKRQVRRRSLRHVSSDPILYHHHARAPSVQRRKQAFGPLDVKPYGYRVGPKEVEAAFKIVAAEEQFEPEKEKETSSVWDYAMLFSSTAMMLEGDMIVNRSRSQSAEEEQQQSSQPKRLPSPPASAIVALQRYPIIPYNPPGPGVPAEQEIFPKIRDRSQGRLWYLDLVPGGSDGRVDADVPLSDAVRPPVTDEEASALFASFPYPEPATPSRRFDVPPVPTRRRSSSPRSPSPQRGRARGVRPMRSTPQPPSPKPRTTPTTQKTISSKHFRAPPVSDVPSTYLIWALKGPGAMMSMHQRRRASVVVNEGREGRGVVGATVDGLRGSARRRVGGDGRVRSALRFEVWDEEL